MKVSEFELIEVIGGNGGIIWQVRMPGIGIGHRVFMTRALAERWIRLYIGGDE